MRIAETISELNNAIEFQNKLNASLEKYGDQVVDIKYSTLVIPYPQQVIEPLVNILATALVIIK